MDRAKNTMISAAKDLCDLAMRVQRPTKVDELATNMKTAKSLGDSVSPRESCRIEFSGTTGVGQRVMATQANYIMDEADSGCGTHRTGATTLPLPYVRPGKLDALPRTEGWIAVCVPADQHPSTKRRTAIPRQPHPTPSDRKATSILFSPGRRMPGAIGSRILGTAGGGLPPAVGAEHRYSCGNSCNSDRCSKQHRMTKFHTGTW
jgi:hypothetical protein